ncbi:hypothetical protein MVEN_01540200 [Mycena venus]|uniref:Uncharacterized protein n=1 Tax=Mycena venus TaxID=2733690 RepID=A0A8H6XWX1_9AGAR|nr:hypothetical protein MVEN_01540200 [Mycena venus]
MDFVQNLDPSKLTLGLAVLSFIISPFAAPPYNLPITLFGVVAAQLQESSDGQALQLFTGLLGGSAIFDIIWMTQNEQNGFVKFLTFVLLIGKIPTFIAFTLALRQRGGHLAGLNIRSGDLSGATVWDSMPGGFGGGGNSGYQNLDEERPPQFSRPAAPPSMPVAQPAPQAPAAAPGAYQTV